MILDDDPIENIPRTLNSLLLAMILDDDPIENIPRTLTSEKLPTFLKRKLENWR